MSQTTRPADVTDRLWWRLVPGSTFPSDRLTVPGSLTTVGPAFDHEGMPREVSILLPTNPGPTRLIETLVDEPDPFNDTILGLFLASPFLNVKVESARLLRSGFRWIANLPSVVQQDEEFSRQLTDVELGFDRELDYLAQFRDAGFRIAVVVSDTPSATAAAAIDPDVVIVLPKVAEFAAGFPSLRQRSSAIQSVTTALRAAGCAGPVLGFGEASEAENEALWPGRPDGLVCRPKARPVAGTARAENKGSP